MNDIKEIKETPVWTLYERGRDFMRRMNIYSETDQNYEFYNGDQWQGAKLGGVERIQNNILKPIVKYKVSVVHNNLYTPLFSPMNYETPSRRAELERYTKLLNAHIARIWELDSMDVKGRTITRDAAINSEGIAYVYYDEDEERPVTEVLDKTDVYYGDEDESDIQRQPYILIRKRIPISEARELAESYGVSKEQIDLILGDGEKLEESDNDCVEGFNEKVTLVYKFYKQKKRVYRTLATRLVTFYEDDDTGLSLYPIAHLLWEEKRGSARARGQGEIKPLIPNQIELNKLEMRRAITITNQAYPQKIIDADKVSNPDDLNKVGGVIKTTGQTVDDVRKIVGTLTPAQMSQDVKLFEEDLIAKTRELAGAGDVATGQVNPEQTSGRAIIAVQQTSQQPIAEQKENYKAFVECLSRIWVDNIIAYAPDNIHMEEKTTDPITGQDAYVIVVVQKAMLAQIKLMLKVDVTPKSIYDRIAQEQTLENLLTGGYLTGQRVMELKVFAEALDDDSTTPKQRILDLCDKIIANQNRIAQMEAQASLMAQRADMFLSEDINTQASRIADAQAKAMRNAQTDESFEGDDALNS